MFLEADHVQVLLLSNLPDDVRRFIIANLSSVAQLEVLLLLRDDRDREWTADEVSRPLYSAASGILRELNDLVAKGLAYVTHAPDTRFRYRPKPDEEVDAIVDRLAHLYKERRAAIISLIYSEPIDKARSFADAFRIRKDKEQ
ncbi:MAG TPA: hypothetical protein VHC22_23355 [Pirellulales bacterium]|nr:hypothetical protein [Pirellulales bacterium]